MSFLQLQDIHKSFGEVEVLQEITLDLEEGEILALLGPSGSGKTTLLRLLAGFEFPGRGTISVAGEDLTQRGPEQRGFGMVFQHYALFPHMTVEQNVAFGLESQGWAKGDITPRVEEMLALVDLAGYGARRVSEISGGQQQRVALARALAPKPRVLLLDEPLSNLDPALRESTRRELREAVRQVGITTVLVTHEQEEAFHVGDRVAVLHGGRLQQVGRPEELYREPATRFVAGFVGRANVLRGEVRSIEGDEAEVFLPDCGVSWRASAVESLQGEVELVLRPEFLRLTQEAEGDLRGRVIERRFTGVLTYAVVAVGDTVELEVLVEKDWEIGDTVSVLEREEAPRARLFSV